MDSELEILKRIWENNGKSNIRLISSQIGFGMDYTRYISNCLRGKGQVKPSADGKDWYGITSRGKRRLRSRGIIKPKLSKKARETKKVVYYLPKKLKVKSLKGDLKEASMKMPKGNLLKAKDEKLNLGRSIAKSAFLLKNQFRD